MHSFNLVQLQAVKLPYIHPFCHLVFYQVPPPFIVMCVETKFQGRLDGIRALALVDLC